MPTGQKCGHCRQPNHNRRTCEAYEQYVAKCQEAARLEQQLADARLAVTENQNIIDVLKSRVTQLAGRLRETEAERDRLRALISGLGVHSAGTRV